MAKLLPGNMRSSVRATQLPTCIPVAQIRARLLSQCPRSAPCQELTERVRRIRREAARGCALSRRALRGRQLDVERAWR
eukprot:3038466-Rhodomonas_salina.1